MSGLAEVAALIQRESGIVIKPSQFSSLAAAISRAAPGSDSGRLLSAATDPAGSADVLERLIDQVAVKETFFFRHPEAFAKQTCHRSERGSCRRRAARNACRQP